MAPSEPTGPPPLRPPPRAAALGPGAARRPTLVVLAGLAVALGAWWAIDGRGSGSLATRARPEVADAVAELVPPGARVGRAAASGRCPVGPTTGTALLFSLRGTTLDATASFLRTELTRRGWREAPLPADRYRPVLALHRDGSEGAVGEDVIVLRPAFRADAADVEVRGRHLPCP